MGLFTKIKELGSISSDLWSLFSRSEEKMVITNNVTLSFLLLLFDTGKEVVLLMQALNSLATPEEKLAALCKKYADLVRWISENIWTTLWNTSIIHAGTYQSNQKYWIYKTFGFINRIYIDDFSLTHLTLLVVLALLALTQQFLYSS